MTSPTPCYRPEGHVVAPGRNFCTACGLVMGKQKRKGKKPKTVKRKIGKLDLSARSKVSEEFRKHW